MKQLSIRNVCLAVGLVLTLSGLALGLGGCSKAQTDNFINGIDNFNRGLAAVDASVKQINATLYAQCNDLVTIASSINDLSGQCSKASPYTSVANSVINNYCQSAAIAQNGGIAVSIGVTASGVSAAKSTLSANKKACAS